MKLICFDLDGTLIHSDKPHLKAFHLSFKKNNLPDVSDAEMIKWFGLEGNKFLPKIFKGLSKKDTNKIVADHNKFLIKKTYIYATKINGIINALKKLKKKYKLAVISNSSHNEIEALLRGANIDHKLFDAFVGADEVKDGKPNIHEIKKAEQITKTKAEYIIGDTIYDIQAGKKAKIKTIAVLTGTTHGLKELKKKKPTLIIKSAADLPNYIL